jgi:hypothetical protein
MNHTTTLAVSAKTGTRRQRIVSQTSSAKMNGSG